MDNTKLVYEKRKCCGCGLCALKCPKQAITMKEDEYGFIYPCIDESKCINCGLCKKVCEYNKENRKNDFQEIGYAGLSNDEKILNSTASGGIFTSIATSFIENGGVVFGSSLEKENDKFIVKHIKVNRLDDLEKLKGSKYVQSNITEIFKDIENEISKGKKVLFSGTPCQVAAVKGLLKNNDNLYTVDIICHGVPSNKMFNDYINYLSEIENIRIEDFKFRDKKKGWGLYYSYNYYDFKKNKYYNKTKPAFKSSYYQMFLNSYIYRENCYSCPYANGNRVADLTIGDYWGIESEHPELITTNKINPRMGVSCIIANSSKGNKLVKKSLNYMVIFDSKYSKIKKHNHQLNYPSKNPKDRELIFNNYKRCGYIAIEEYYKNKDKIKKAIKNIWYMLPYKIRKTIKK